MNIVREHHRRSVGRLFRGARGFIGEMNRIADATCTIGLNRADGGVEAWRPSTDIFAREADMVIRCDLTGVEPEDVEINFTEHRLTITGTERPAPRQDVARPVASRSRGDFRRDIMLCPGLTYEDVHAMFDEGVLEITLADAARQSSKETLILVNAAGKVPSPRDPAVEESEPEIPQQA